MSEIILKPILSEKSLTATTSGKYVFKVANSANKPEIQAALKKIYKVKAKKVNIINLHPEEKIRRGHKTQTKAFKKAVVTLAKGQKIEGFEFKE